VTLSRPCLVALSVVAGAATIAHTADAAPTMAECLAANESAISLRATHKLRQARDRSLACAAVSCPAVVRDVCQKRVTDLTGTIPTVVLQATDASGEGLRHVRVTVDGVPVVVPIDGSAVEIDPGPHAFSFEVPGQPAVQQPILIYDGDRARPITIPSATVIATPHEGFTRQQIIGLGVGGVGAAGIVVGAALGFLTISAWSSAGSDCGSGGTSRCSASGAPSAQSDRSTAETDGAASTAAFIIGGALVATGATLFFLKGHGDQNSSPPPIALVPSLGIGGTQGLTIVGAF